MFFFFGQMIDNYLKRLFNMIFSIKDVTHKAIVAILLATVLIWMSVFFYATFYYTYMPSISHTRPVHLQFKSCGKKSGICSFPSANVTLTRKQQLLMVGQSYRVYLDIEMPESPANEKLGMFMVCIQLKDRNWEDVEISCRSAMLHYKSSLLRTISTFVFVPILLSGSAEEKQIVPVELFSQFEEDPNRPITDVQVEVQTHFIEVYSSQLRIHAHFTGLRYFMFQWPVVSATVGISTNLFFLSIIVLLSWYHFFYPHTLSIEESKSDEKRRAEVLEQIRAEKKKLQEECLPESAHTSSSNKDSTEEDPKTPSAPSKESLNLPLDAGQKAEEFEVIGKDDTPEGFATPPKIEELGSQEEHFAHHADL